ncbi:MAG TPA: hypothetical protein VF883_21415 [Thermoanaerobaculia bacterium]|jgi:hypothetical protein
MSRQQHVVAAVLFVALAVAATWPLAPNLDRAVADPGDPLLNVWILDWDWWATFRAPLSLFHAPAFHPAKYALAYSENLYGIALLLFPLRFAGVGAVAAYNVAMIAGFALCGFGAYVLGVRLTRSFAAGIAAGVFYMLVPFRFVHLSQVQHVWGGWLPLMLAALLAYAERPTWKRAAVFATLFVMNGLTNIHYLLFGALATAITAALLLPRRDWRVLAIATGIALLVLAPFLYPYLKVAKLYGMQRGADEVARYSAVPLDWLSNPAEPERKLYPGALALVCLVLASLLVARNPAGVPSAAEPHLPSNEQRQTFAREGATLLLAWLWVAIGFAGSLGLNFVFHEFLFGAVPGFRAIRAPARWAVIGYIGLAIAIAIVTAALARRNRWAAWIVPVAFAVTLWTAPVRWFLLDPETPPVYRWLSMQNVAAVAELPMDTLSSDYEYLLYATAHHKPIVNGVSGFSPPTRIELSRLSREFTPAFIDALNEAGVEWIIVHGDRYGEDGRKLRDWLERELNDGRLRYVAHFDAKTGADWVFSLRGGRGPRPRDVDVFLYGAAVCVESIAGAMDFPLGKHVYRGPARFYGWASSPEGVARVDLWFNNRRVRYPAKLTALPPQGCAGAPPVRFELAFASRPKDIRARTDVQVEVTDRKGRKRVFEDRWISWE